MPEWKKYVREHLPPLGLSGEREAEIREELAQQLEDAYSEAVTGGASEESAAQHAANQIPDWAALAREIREADQPLAEKMTTRLDRAAFGAVQPGENFNTNPAPRRWGIFMSHLWQDLRYGIRTLQKNVGFTVVVVLTLALGIGANATIFTVINAVLLQSLPYPQSDRIVVLHESNLGKGLSTFSFSPPNYLDWRSQNHVFEQMAAFNEGGYTYTGGDAPEQLSDLEVTDGFFEILRAKPLIGRSFAVEEFQPGKDHEVILT
ncbi:MAG: ABC transporter permease, partial [Candidatus Acidiferrales bacterium]